MTKAQEVSPERFAKWMRTQPTQPKLIKLTPEIALEALTANTDEFDADGKRKQRPLSQGIVLDYSRQMEAGEWRTLATPVAISSDGCVLDGQHRLHAVMRSEATISSWVFFNQDPADFPFYDIGKKRTSADIFAIYGVGDAGAAAAVTRQVLVLASGGHRGQSTGFAPRMNPEEFYRAYLNIGVDKITHGLRVYRRIKKGMMAYPAPLAAVYLAAFDKDPVMADAFFDALSSGANLGVRSIEKRLRDHLIYTGSDQSAAKTVADVVRAWNAKRGKKRTFSLAPITVPIEMI